MLKAILLLCLLTPSLSFSQIIRKINGVEIKREELPFNLNGNLKLHSVIVNKGLVPSHSKLLLKKELAETKEILIFSELNKKERDHFAHLAHTLSKRCGSIEEFNLSDTTLDVETLLEPKISPFKTISGLSDYLSSISIDNIKSHISSFESLNTRHYESSGSTATNAVVTRINSIISSNSRFTLEQVTHSSYDQKVLL